MDKKSWRIDISFRHCFDIDINQEILRLGRGHGSFSKITRTRLQQVDVRE